MLLIWSTSKFKVRLDKQRTWSQNTLEGVSTKGVVQNGSAWLHFKIAIQWT